MESLSLLKTDPGPVNPLPNCPIIDRNLRHETGTNMYQKQKRVFDIIVATGMALVAAPIGAAVTVLLLIAHRKVLFRQERPGLHGEPFVLFKFNTMNEERDEDGFLLPDAERLTRIGSLIRSLSLDELPQLWNVLKGDMSLVGPRPLLMKYMERYSAEQTRRHEVIPGITGWAQVNGRNAISWEEKFAYDVWYVDHASVSLDIRILLMTIVKVVRRAGVSNPGNATMPEFEGTTRSICIRDFEWHPEASLDETGSNAESA